MLQHVRNNNAKTQSIPISPEKMSNLSMTLLPDGGVDLIVGS